jgi:hypothetical protein
VFFDGDIIGTHVSSSHDAFLIVLPVLVAVCPIPLPIFVMPLVLEAHGDAVAGVAPQLLHEAVVQLLLPLAGQELNDGLPPFEELRPVPPLAVHCVRLCNSFGIPGIPPVLCCLHFRNCRLQSERRANFDSHDFSKRKDRPELENELNLVRLNNNKFPYRPIPRLQAPISSFSPVLSDISLTPHDATAEW